MLLLVNICPLAKTRPLKAKDTTSQSKTSFLPSKFEAQFEQNFKSTLTGKIRKSNGTIKYKYPGNIRLEISDQESSTLTYVNNSKKSWYYTPPFEPDGEGQVIIQEDHKFLMTHLFDALRNGLQNNKIYKIKKEKNIHHLIFNTESSKKYGLKKASIIFKDKKPQQLEYMQSLEIIYLDNKNVKFNFLSFKKNTKILSKDFVFEVPKKTEVIKK